MRVVVFAYHDVGSVCLERLVRDGHEVAALFTHRDDPRERPWFASVADSARTLGIPLHRPRDVNRQAWFDRIRALDPELIFSFYYRRLLAPEITGMPPRGALNLHGSLLPRYRGRCPLNWALIHGESETGVTLHHMTEVPDGGDVVAQQAIAIEERDSAPTLHRKVVAAASELLGRTLPALERGTAPRIPQDPAAASCFGRRRPGDGRIDWSRPARSIHDLVRAVTAPWPGAFTSIGRRKLYVWESDWESARADAGRGEVLPGPGLRVATGAGCLSILRGQIEGYPPAPASRLAATIPPGTKLGPDEVISCAS